MLPKEEKTKKDGFFHLPPEDRMEFALEDKEKQEKELAKEKVFHKLNEKK